ncbi:Cullin [Entamoeba marina]
MSQLMCPQIYTEDQYNKISHDLFDEFQIIMDKAEHLDSAKLMLHYYTVYAICISPHESFKERLYEEIVLFIRKQTNKLQHLIEDVNDLKLLNVYCDHFNKFLKGIHGIERSCKYLTQHTILDDIHKHGLLARYKEISDIGKLEWKNNVVTKESDDLDAVKKYTTHLLTLHDIKGSNIIGLYVEEFENFYLNDLTIQTKEWSSIHIKDMEIFDYLQCGLDKLKFEQQVIGGCLDSITYDKISLKISEQQWKFHTDTISKSIPNAFSSKNKQNIKLLFYYLFLFGFENWIEETLKNSLATFEKPKVNTGIALMDLYMEVYNSIVDILDLFEGKLMFSTAFQNEIKKFLNLESNSYHESHPKYIAQYVDVLLRGIGPGKDSKEVVKSKIDQLMSILQYVQNKDIFMHFHSNFLARRLINKTNSVDEDIDHAATDSIRGVCGFGYTSKLSQMTTDVNNSVLLNSTFHESHKTPLYVNVLTLGVWPFSTESSISNILPNEIEQSQELFQQMYLKKNPIRISVATLRFDVIMPGLYFIVLQAISVYGNEWKNHSALEKLGVIHLCGGHLEFNVKYFVNKKVKKITIFAQEISKLKKEDTNNDNITANRKLVLQAMIVRIMKQKKQCTHEVLVEEIMRITSTKFVPTTLLIKEVIGFLIDKEYLCRKEGDMTTYEYVY